MEGFIMPEIVLGNVYEDRISEFTGIATARTEFLNGCVRIALTPKIGEDKKPIETEWFDEQQLIEKKTHHVRSDCSPESETKSPPRGGPGPSPPSVDCPKTF
jgi:hypothetical protein